MDTLKNEPIMNDLKLKFGTNTNQIDANTLINSILHFSSLIQEVNKGLNTNRKIEVKVNAFEPGSFIVNIVIESGIIETIGNLFTKENLSVATGLITVVGGVYKAAKFLKGENPKSVVEKSDGVTITNRDGNVTIINKNVYNIYKRPAVQETLTKEFETLESDPEIQSFDIIDKEDHEIISVDRSEFSDLASSEFISSENNRIVQKDAILNIISLSFEKRKKWEFLYDGRKIQAKINDDVFLELIEKGEAFAKGNVLEAKLEVLQIHNPVANAYANHSYKVVKIIHHQARPKQDQLPFLDDDDSDIF